MLTDEQRAIGRPVVDAAPSLASDLTWLLCMAARPTMQARYPQLAEMFNGRERLVDSVRTFWDDVSWDLGFTEVQVLALMGGVQIIVPPGLPVEVAGTAIMGGFGHVERIPARLDPEVPVLRIRGAAVMGGVAVETRLPGESESEAHRRRRRDRRALRAGAPPKRLPEKTRADR